MTFNFRYFIGFLVLFLIEVLIAFYVKQEFIRYVFGDYLVVILMYCFIKSFTSIKPIYAGIITLLSAYFIEFCQLVDVLGMLNIEKNTFTNLVFGTTFQIGDLIAYTLGVITILGIEKAVLKE